MTKRHRILFLLAGLVLGVGVYVLFFGEREPNYQGRKLSYWVGRMSPMQAATDPLKFREAGDAIRHIGPKAVPYLVKWIAQEPTPAWRKEFDRVCRRHEALRSLATDEEARQMCPDGAGLAFQFLGDAGKEAMPALVRLLNDPNVTGYRAARAFGYPGTDFLPPLVAAVTNQNRNPYDRMECMLAIRRFGSKAGPAVPALIECLKDPDQLVRREAVHALGMLRLEPALVVPAMTGALQDPDPQVRFAAGSRLGWFGKEAAFAVPALRTARLNADPTLREIATRALREIAPEPLTNAPPP